MAEPLGVEHIGWVQQGSKTQEPFAWIVRCPEHPPEGELWDRIPAGDLPPEAPGCEECGESL